MSHKQIAGPKPKAFNSANALFCRYCSEVLAYTLDRKNYGLLGIKAVLIEEAKCEKKPAVIPSRERHSR